MGTGNTRREVLNMKKLFKLGAVAAVVCMLCFALAGCGGKSETIEGNWEVSGGTSEGVTLDESTLSMMKSLDMNLILVVNSDGTCSLDIFSYFVADGTWADKGDGKYSFTMTGDEFTNFDATLSGGTLTVDIDGDTMTMKKGGADLKTKLETDRSNTSSWLDDALTLE